MVWVDRLVKAFYVVVMISAILAALGAWLTPIYYGNFAKAASFQQEVMNKKLFEGGLGGGLDFVDMFMSIDPSQMCKSMKNFAQGDDITPFLGEHGFGGSCSAMAQSNLQINIFPLAFGLVVTPGTYVNVASGTNDFGTPVLLGTVSVPNIPPLSLLSLAIDNQGTVARTVLVQLLVVETSALGEFGKTLISFEALVVVPGSSAAVVTPQANVKVLYFPASGQGSDVATDDEGHDAVWVRVRDIGVSGPTNYGIVAVFIPEIPQF